MERQENEISQVLIVDDDPTARDTLEALLTPEDYHLAFVTGGQEALARLDVFVPAPDVILLDVMMPGLDGFEVCQRIKADERWRHIPVILITALDSRDDVVRGLDAGADEFLSKPVSGPELRARVRSMLRIKHQFDQLQATMQLREDLSHMIVHDMKSPLTVMLMTALTLKARVADPYDVELLGTMEREARRLESFMTDMLTMAKMQAGRLILNRSPVDVNELVQSVQQTYNPVAQSTDVHLVTDLSDGTGHLVSLDESLFRRVLDNLLSNALKFSPSGSTVTLRVAYPVSTTSHPSPAPIIRVQVVDEGPGIAEEHWERIFDQFEIVSLKLEGIRQVGLGLAFCKLVVEAHDGRIFVEANEPRGSVFTVELYDNDHGNDITRNDE